MEISNPKSYELTLVLNKVYWRQVRKLILLASAYELTTSRQWETNTWLYLKKAYWNKDISKAGIMVDERSVFIFSNN